MYNIYLVEYYDMSIDKKEHIIISVSDDIEEFTPNLPKQIFEFIHHNEYYQGEINIITVEKLYSTTENVAEVYKFLTIKGETE